MQTIKVNTEQIGYGYEFCNGNMAIATVKEYTPGHFTLRVTGKPYGEVDSLAMAFEVIGDKIEALFAALGLDVEFV